METDLTNIRYSTPEVLNSPLEVGLRGMFVLAVSRADAMRLERIVAYDYLATHPEDFGGDTQSLHVAVPYRSGELLVRPEVMKRGLMIMQSKELVQLVFTKDGLSYRAQRTTTRFIEYFESPYSAALKASLHQVDTRFAAISDSELDSFVSEHLSIWGGEYDNEAMMRGKSA